MSQALALAATTAVGTAEHTKLPMAPLMFAIIAITSFVALLGLTWTFRGFSNKHD